MGTTREIKEWLADYERAELSQVYQQLYGDRDMSLTVTDTGSGDFEITPSGTHLARCYLIAELGHQKTSWQGKDLIKPQVMISWELVNELMEDKRPFVISRTYTASLSEKANLRADLETWRSRSFTEEEIKGFDLKKVLGAPCQITVVHTAKNNKTYANVKGVTAIPKGTVVPELQNKAVAYEIHNQETFKMLPEWIQKKIESRVEPTETENPAPTGHETDFIDDDIPF